MRKAHIRPLQDGDQRDWLRMRRALWPDWPRRMHLAEMEEALRLPDIRSVLVHDRGGGELGGFIEVHIRKRVNHARSPLVAYVEGWYVDPDLRRRQVGRALLGAAEDWARKKGMTEIASDAEIRNRASQRAHRRLGFEESYRLVHFLKDI